MFITIYNYEFIVESRSKDFKGLQNSEPHYVFFCCILITVPNWWFNTIYILPLKAIIYRNTYLQQLVLFVNFRDEYCVAAIIVTTLI